MKKIVYLERLMILFIFIVTIVIVYIIYIQKLKESSISKGVKWLLLSYAQNPQATAPYLTQIYKVMKNNILTDEIASHSDCKEFTTDWNSTLYSQTLVILTEHCKEDKSCNAIQNTQDLHEYVLLNGWNPLLSRFDPAEKLIIAYLLKKSSLIRQSAQIREKALFDLRSQKKNISFPLTQDMRKYLYGITHIILTDSGYYSSYLDPKNYENELSVFHDVIKKFIAADTSDAIDLDIVSEAKIGLKLLRNHDFSYINLLSDGKIMRRQNGDGSWGKGKNTSSGKLHHTTMAIVALSDFINILHTTSVVCH